MKIASQILFFLLLCLFSEAQVLQPTLATTPEGYSRLLEDPEVIKENDLLNEQILDLVNVYLTDSVIVRKTQRHRVVGSVFLPTLGYKWLTINYRKEKFVATATSNLRVPREGSDLYTEYDVNWNLTSHLPAYQKLEMEGYARQKEIGRQKKRFNYYQNPPFTPITAESSLEPYHLHCEHTPLIDYRPMFNQLFMPVIAPMNPEIHPNFKDKRPSVGIYGAFISDCNHTCHPEIHPYEWIWWLNLSQNPGCGPNTKEWLIGLIREGSNRFPKWSPSPRIGEISVPFAFPASKEELTITIEHLVFGPFEPEGLAQINIPENAFDLNFHEKTFTFENPDLQSKKITLKSPRPLISEGLKCWIGTVNYDKESGLITGKIHFAASVKDLWTCKLTTDF